MPRTCCIDGCLRAVVADDMCGMHYMRVKRTGSPLKVSRLVGATAEERLWYYVRKTPTCWIWTGGISHGYGTLYVKIDGKDTQVQAHRFAYELLVAPIPDGLTLDHTCHTADSTCTAGQKCPHRRCVNPAHLKPMPLRENVLVGHNIPAGNKAKTHCKRGHEFTPENTYVMANGGRSCRECQRIHDANRRERDRAKKG